MTQLVVRGEALKRASSRTTTINSMKSGRDDFQSRRDHKKKATRTVRETPNAHNAGKGAGPARPGRLDL